LFVAGRPRAPVVHPLLFEFAAFAAFPAAGPVPAPGGGVSDLPALATGLPAGLPSVFGALSS
jgi:hypothetical protein